jgi:hypothetical protein
MSQSATVTVVENTVTVSLPDSATRVVTVTTSGPQGLPGDAGADFEPWNRFTVSYTQLQTGALTNEIQYALLPARYVIDGIIIKTSTAFAGTSISSLLFEIGISGETDRHIAGYNALASVADSNHVMADVRDFFSLSSTKSLRIKATAVGANLSALSQGLLEVFVKWAELPEE